MSIVLYIPQGWHFTAWQEAWPHAQLLHEAHLYPGASFVVIMAGMEKWLELVSAYSPKAAVLVLSREPSLSELQQAMGHGARGYLDFSSSAATLQAAEQSLRHGALWVPPGFLDRLLAVFSQVLPAATHPFAALSEREREVAQAVCQGLSNKAIALQLGIGERTVKQHLTHIFSKLGVKDRMQLLVISREAGR